MEDGILRQVDRLRRGELGTNVVDVGHELAPQLPDQIQKTMTVEVDPDEAAGDAALLLGGRNLPVGGAECFGTTNLSCRLLTYRQSTVDTHGPSFGPNLESPYEAAAPPSSFSSSPDPFPDQPAASPCPLRHPVGPTGMDPGGT